MPVFGSIRALLDGDGRQVATPLGHALAEFFDHFAQIANGLPRVRRACVRSHLSNRLLESPSDRNIVQVFSKDETKLYATILAIPDYRLTPASKTIVRFEERPAGTPEAIKEWFYPGDQFGEEFAYPKSRAVQLAKTTNQNIVTIPNETAQNITKPAKTAQEPPVVALKTAPVTAVNPKGAEVEIAQAAIPKPSGTPASGAFNFVRCKKKWVRPRFPKSA